MEAREARIAAEAKREGGYRPVAGAPLVHRYSAERDVACRQVGIPYGKVGVAGLPDHVRSHEMHLDNKDATGFLPPPRLRQERSEQQLLRDEAEFEGGAWGAARRAEFNAWREAKRRAERLECLEGRLEGRETTLETLCAGGGGAR